jgi:hypothetical protein
MIATYDGSIVEVLACAEAAAGAGQDDDPRVGDLVQRFLELFVHRGREAVQPVRPIERDSGDRPVMLDDDVLILGHGALPDLSAGQEGSRLSGQEDPR